ncbi:hypothetical protein NFI96_005283 [Prochilodus magdalenae]|nr:hypothetical protein NFI96_005283 [Prochilodus magdalenae]
MEYSSRLTSSSYTETRRTSWSSTTSSTTSSTHRPLRRGITWTPSTFSRSSTSLSSSSSWDSMESDTSSVQQLQPGNQRMEKSEEIQSYRRASCGSMSSSDQKGAVMSRTQHGSGSVLGVTTGQGAAVVGGALQQLELKIEAKLKFSQFLDEVTHQVLRPTSLQAFQCRRRSNSTDAHCVQLHAPQDQLEDRSARPLQLRMQETVGRTYLETDIDSVFRGEELKEVKVKKETAITFQSTERKDGMESPESSSGSHQSLMTFSRNPPRSLSLPRGINLVSPKT